uniref:Uncharacterized protein n=1 Tax=Heterorhabditis bacteriophora TaxID=37862 RepID=A0A1I7WBB6_HETBA
MVWGQFPGSETVKDLQNSIYKAWNEVDESVIKNLVNSKPERIFQVINRSGSFNCYVHLLLFFLS